MKTSKYFQGHIMLFGLIRIRRDFAFFQEICGEKQHKAACYTNNADFIKRLAEVNSSKFIERLEPFLQHLCTIKWVECEKEPALVSYC